MNTEIIKETVQHPELGPLEKWYKVVKNANGEIIEKEFWGYDEIGVANGGKQKGDWTVN